MNSLDFVCLLVCFGACFAAALEHKMQFQVAGKIQSDTGLLQRADQHGRDSL